MARVRHADHEEALRCPSLSGARTAMLSATPSEAGGLGRKWNSGVAQEDTGAQGQHFCAARQELSEGLVEGRTVTEGVG